MSRDADRFGGVLRAVRAFEPATMSEITSFLGVHGDVVRRSPLYNRIAVAVCRLVRQGRLVSNGAPRTTERTFSIPRKR